MIEKTLELGSRELLVVGPIYDKVEKLPLLSKLVQDKLVIFLGDACYPYKSIPEAVARLNELRSFIEENKALYLLGDKDLVFMKKICNSNVDTYDWLSSQRKALRFSFNNGSNVLLIHGGILPRHSTWNQAQTDTESAFVSQNKETGKNWHEEYDGRFGYAISSHTYPVSSEVKTFNHSASLDTNCYETDKLAVQTFGPSGLCETLYI